MNILVVDGDRRLLELLRSLLEGEGHQVSAVDDGLRAGALLRSRLPDLAVLSVHLPRTSGLDLLSELREQSGGAEVTVVLTSGGRGAGDPKVARAMSELGVEHLLEKPFPMFDLIDIVREVVETRAESGSAAAADPLAASARRERTEDPLSALVRASAPPMAGAIAPGRTSDVRLGTMSNLSERALHQDNLRRLSGLWVRRASGVITLEGGPGNASGWMALGEGGPLDSSGWELLSAALHGGVLDFERREVPAAGDHLGLGAMIFGRVRDPDATGHLVEGRMLALMPPRHPTPLLGLPLRPAGRALLEQSDPATPVGELAAALDLDLEEAGPDIEALVRMGLVELAQPTLREAGPPTRTVRPRATAASPGPSTRSGDRGASNAQDTMLPGDQARLPSPDSSSSGGEESPTEAYNAVGPTRSETPSVRERLASRRREQDSDSVSTRTRARRPLGGSQGGDSRRRRAVVVRRLRREAALIETEGPEVLLGVPAKAEPSLVRAAHGRMKERYLAMAADTGLPAEGRTHATRLARAVDEARDMLLSGRRPSRVEVVPEEERLLNHARQSIQHGDWPKALAALRRARDLRLDHPGILANLGWATLHDESLDEVDREEEARGLLALAVQFAPEDAEANFLLARFLASQEDPRGALGYALRALKADQQDPSIQELVRQLRGRLQKSTES